MTIRNHLRYGVDDLSFFLVLIIHIIEGKGKGGVQKGEKGD